MKNYSKLIPLFILLIFVSVACVGIQIKDPVRVGLYTMRTEALSIREYVIKEHYLGRISETELTKFKIIDDQFTSLYNITLTMYQTEYTGPEFEKNLTQIKYLLIEMRQKYYKEK